MLLVTRCALLAACVVLGSGQTSAQLAGSDPLAPKLESDPRKPPRFQTAAPRPLAPAEQPTTFAPAPGAGDTGFDATNTGKKKPKPKRNGVAEPAAAPPKPSPYQTPPPGAAAADAALAASPPGTPPVETIEPVTPAKKRKPRGEPLDPYDPLGIRLGTIDLYPAVELNAGYDTNPGRAANAAGAALFRVAPELKAQSNWSRHELKADLRGSYNWYTPDQTPTLNRPFFNSKVDGRVDVTHDTRIDLNTRLLVSTDSPNSPNLQAGLAKLPVFARFGADAGVGQRFNRLDLSLKGTFDRTVYQDSQLVDGTTASNADRKYNQYGGKLRAGYELLPGVVPFVEADADTRVHDLNTDFFGYQRDSKGVTSKVGTTFELSRLLIGEISLGYTKRTYEDPRLDAIAGLIGDGSLTWTATTLTTVKLTAASAVGESAVPGVSGVFYRDVGLQVDHAFRQWLIGSIKLGFGFDDYVGLSREDKRYSAAAGLTYKLNRSWQVKGEVRQDWLRSNVTGADYTATSFIAGLRWQR